MRQQVTAVAMTASDGISESVSKCEQENAEARKQLDELQNSLDHITAKLSPNKTSSLGLTLSASRSEAIMKEK